MKRALVLIPVRWLNAAWKQPLSGARRLAAPLRELGGVALLRRPLKFPSLHDSMSKASRFQPHSIHP